MERHFLLLRFKYVLVELHGCARQRELGLIANKIWFSIHPRNLNLGSHLSVRLSVCLPHHGNAVKKGIRWPVSHDLIAGSDVDPLKFRTIGHFRVPKNLSFKRRLSAKPWALSLFPFNKNSGLKFGKLHVLNGTVHSSCTDPTQATARFGIVASQQTQNNTLKEKSKYGLYPKEHSTVEKGRCKTKGGGILFRVESLWKQVKVKNSRELKRYVSQNIRTIRSNSWNCTVNKFGVLANLYSARLCCIHFSLIDKLL